MRHRWFSKFSEEGLYCKHVVLQLSCSTTDHKIQIVLEHYRFERSDKVKLFATWLNICRGFFEWKCAYREKSVRYLWEICGKAARRPWENCENYMVRFFRESDCQNLWLLGGIKEFYVLCELSNLCSWQLADQLNLKLKLNVRV